MPSGIHTGDRWPSPVVVIGVRRHGVGRDNRITLQRLACSGLRGCADRRVANVSIRDEEPILQHGESAKMKSGEPIRASSKFVETLDEGIALLCRHKALPPFPHALHPSVSGYCNGRCEYDATSENYPSETV